MQAYRILWADDEIDFLKPHLLFLEKKGYLLTAVNSGTEAVERCEQEIFDVVFLDENMPGMSGLEALQEIKAMRPTLPVVMITKNQEEHIMEEAIGAQITDYLIKPVKPQQVLLALKKILDQRRIVTEKTNHNYQRSFQQISMSLNDAINADDWTELYRQLVYWEIEIEKTENKSMKEVLEMQKDEANVNFLKFVREQYAHWMDPQNKTDKPLLSHELMAQKVFPLLRQDEHKQKTVFFILIDNLRYDQWRVLESDITAYFRVREESFYYSILPTTTAFARNAVFSGLTPLDLSQRLPQYWVNDDEEGKKNNFEAELLQEQLKRAGLSQTKMSYHKILRQEQAKKLNDHLKTFYDQDFVAIVYNFVDMLSHARTDTTIIRELAPDEAAYRSITRSWFLHASLFDTLKQLSLAGHTVILTTDHGTIRTKRPYKIIGDRDTNTNLRYKNGRNLTYKDKNVLVAHQPEAFGLPKSKLTSSYVFASEDYFFAYPNNYNYYVNYYKDTFQHGGVSLEEMIIPFVILEGR
ncbi:MAG: PglZ domain-containing protein [Bernardetiaceae bacterium]